MQLRDKIATDAETADQLVELSRVIAGRALLLVNDRVDAALAARDRGARVDGVHLGQGMRRCSGRASDWVPRRSSG